MSHPWSEPPVRRLTVLYDGGCRLCRAARSWLEKRHQWVPLEFVAAGSAQARQRYPTLDHAATLQEVTVVADSGAVYTGDAAWLMCLWALSGYRELSLRLARQENRGVARRVVAIAAGIRERTSGNQYGFECDDACQP